MDAGDGRRRQAGFTLIELEITIAIIAIIAAIATPNLLAARKTANEAAAISSLRTLVNTQALFRDTDPDGDGLPDYATLAELESHMLIDSVLASGTKQGYLFDVVPAGGPPYTWTGTADPASERTGTRHFFVDESGVIRFHDSDPAGPGDTAINGEGPAPSTPEQEAFAQELREEASTTAQELDALVTGSVVTLARQLVADPAAVQSVLAALDEDQTGKLELSEVLDADLLSLARQLVPELVGEDQGAAIGADPDVVLLYEAYQQLLRDRLELDKWNEDPPPGVELSLLTGDPEGFLAALLEGIPALGGVALGVLLLGTFLVLRGLARRRALQSRS